MLNRMSDLVNQIRSRSQSSTSSGSKTKKGKMERVKEHRIQVRWSHWNKAKCEFMPVKQKNGGGNRYIVYTDPPSLLLGELKQNAIDLFSPAVRTDFFRNFSHNRWRLHKEFFPLKVLLSSILSWTYFSLEV